MVCNNIGGIKIILVLHLVQFGMFLGMNNFNHG